MPTRICSPSTTRRARLRVAVFAPGRRLPAALIASMTLAPVGRVTTPGWRTLPATSTIRVVVGGLAPLVLVPPRVPSLVLVGRVTGRAAGWITGGGAGWGFGREYQRKTPASRAASVPTAASTRIPGGPGSKRLFRSRLPKDRRPVDSSLEGQPPSVDTAQACSGSPWAVLLGAAGVFSSCAASSSAVNSTSSSPRTVPLRLAHGLSTSPHAPSGGAPEGLSDGRGGLPKDSGGRNASLRRSVGEGGGGRFTSATLSPHHMPQQSRRALWKTTAVTGPASVRRGSRHPGLRHRHAGVDGVPSRCSPGGLSGW